jgi:hypothetical protein
MSRQRTNKTAPLAAVSGAGISFPFGSAAERAHEQVTIHGGIMKIVIAVLLLAVASVTAAGQSAAPQETGDPKPPFTLTISASPSNPALEDTADQTVKSGNSVVLRIRKTNTSDREIVKWPTTGGPFGDTFEARDSSGNLVELRKSDEVATHGGGEGRLRGTVTTQPS